MGAGLDSVLTFLMGPVRVVAPLCIFVIVRNCMSVMTFTGRILPQIVGGVLRCCGIPPWCVTHTGGLVF